MADVAAEEWARYAQPADEVARALRRAESAHEQRPPHGRNVLVEVELTKSAAAATTTRATVNFQVDWPAVMASVENLFRHYLGARPVAGVQAATPGSPPVDALAPGAHSGQVATSAATEPQLLRQVNAQLPALPAPLRLRHGPLLVTIEYWSDGTVVAKHPALRLYGEGTSDVEALDALGDEIHEAAVDLSDLARQGVPFGGAAAQMWAALSALVEMPQ
jgi:hypothetical protein